MWFWYVCMYIQFCKYICMYVCIQVDILLLSLCQLVFFVFVFCYSISLFNFFFFFHHTLLILHNNIPQTETVLVLDYWRRRQRRIRWRRRRRRNEKGGLLSVIVLFLSVYIYICMHVCVGKDIKRTTRILEKAFGFCGFVCVGGTVVIVVEVRFFLKVVSQVGGIFYTASGLMIVVYDVVGCVCGVKQCMPFVVISYSVI